MKKQTELKRLKNKCVEIAIKKHLEEYPNCFICDEPAITAHHFVEQAISNYLRTKDYNLISVCANHHFKIHHSKESGLAIGYIVRKKGGRWFNKIQKGSQIRIHDNISYWQKELKKLCSTS